MFMHGSSREFEYNPRSMHATMARIETKLDAYREESKEARSDHAKRITYLEGKTNWVMGFAAAVAVGAAFLKDLFLSAIHRS